MQINAEYMQREGHLQTWIKSLREDLLDPEIADGFWEDHIAWRAIIHVANPYSL